MDVVVNAAMSADGKLSTVERRQVRISGPDDFARVDRRRASVDAVMVGIGTVLADDPSLGVKREALQDARIERGEPRHPARVVVDSRARTPPDAAIFDVGETVHLLVSEGAPQSNIAALEGEAVVHRAGTDRVDLSRGLAALATHGIESVLVEGGGELIFSLFDARLVDRLVVFVGSCIIGGADAPTLADGSGFLREETFPTLALESIERLDDGVLIEWDVRDGANRER